MVLVLKNKKLFESLPIRNSKKMQRPWFSRAGLLLLSVGTLSIYVAFSAVHGKVTSVTHVFREWPLAASGTAGLGSTLMLFGSQALLVPACAMWLVVFSSNPFGSPIIMALHFLFALVFMVTTLQELKWGVAKWMGYLSFGAAAICNLVVLGANLPDANAGVGICELVFVLAVGVGFSVESPVPIQLTEEGKEQIRKSGVALFSAGSLLCYAAFSALSNQVVYLSDMFRDWPLASSATTGIGATLLLYSTVDYKVLPATCALWLAMGSSDYKGQTSISWMHHAFSIILVGSLIVHVYYSGAGKLASASVLCAAGGIAGSSLAVDINSELNGAKMALGITEVIFLVLVGLSLFPEPPKQKSTASVLDRLFLQPFLLRR